jgi:hypothetical protein
MSEPRPVTQSMPAAAKTLGIAGLVPFLAATLLFLFANKPEQRALGLQAFCFYSAIILSFLGGVRWGAALPLPAFQLLLRAVLPSLVAFACLLATPERALPFLCLAYMAVGWSDSTRATHALWPEWYKRLRLALTVAVVSLHLIALLHLKQVF